MDYLFARAIFHDLWLHVPQVQCGAEELNCFTKAHWRFRFQQRAEFRGDLVHGIRAQAQGHPFPRTHRIDGKREGRGLAVDGGFLNEQRLAAAGRFHLAVGEFGDFEFGGERLRDAGQFTRPFELLHELPEGFKCHTSASLPDGLTVAKERSPGHGLWRWDYNSLTGRHSGMPSCQYCVSEVIEPSSSISRILRRANGPICCSFT